MCFEGWLPFQKYSPSLLVWQTLGTVTTDQIRPSRCSIHSTEKTFEHRVSENDRKFTMRSQETNRMRAFQK